MNKTLLTIFGFLALIVVVTGASLYFIPKLVRITSRPQTQNQAKVATPEPDIPRDKTVSTVITENREQWKTITTQDGLSFNYPPEWKAKEVTKYKVLLYTPDLLAPPKGTPISVYINTTSTFDQVLMDIRKVIKNPQETAVNYNFSGLQISGFITVTSLGQVQLISTVLNYQTKAIVAEYSVYPDAQDYRQVYDDIIKSIKVISQ